MIKLFIQSVIRFQGNNPPLTKANPKKYKNTEAKT